ncbi:MAG: serine/threonine-protein kinase [Fuerstiella sp.]
MSTSSLENDDVADAYVAVDLLATDFLARYRDGDRPSVEDYARRHPSLSDEILRMFPLIASVEKLKIDQQVSSDGTATLAGHQLKQLGDFRIIREIGRGGMGIVFEAEQESLGRSVAIKVLPKQCLLDDGALDRFHQEARMAAAMHHSNIVPVFGTGESDGSHYLVLQLVRGQSLSQKLAGLEQPMPSGEVAAIGYQLADAIAYAHENGVLHRDIKPANVLLSDDGTAQITDFGLARNLSDDPTTTQTLSGSLRYMAPERFQAISNERSDVYSLGLTLFEMVAGRPAFVQEDPEQLIQAMTNPKVASLRSLCPGVPIDLETIISKATHPEPAIRYQSAGDFRDDLKRFMNDEPIQARRISKLQCAIRWCRRNPKIATAIAVTSMSLVLMTVISTVAFMVTSSANQRTLTALNESERSLNLAVQSLDGVVEVVSIAASIGPVGSDSGDGGMEFNLTDLSFSPSPNSARLLERIQPLYERLAQQAPTRPDIVLQMVDASIQLARIQNQLGRTKTAVRTLQNSIDVLNFRAAEAQVSNDAKQLRLGRLFNELGSIRSANLDSASVDSAYEQALQALGSVDDQATFLKLEQVQAHLALSRISPGERRSRQFNQNENAVRAAHVSDAMQLLDDLREDEVETKSAHIFRARGYLAMSRLTDRPEERRQHFNMAIAELKEQLALFPDDAASRFELVQILGDVSVRRDRMPDHLRGQWQPMRQRLTEALAELKPLHAQFPGNPAFATAEVHLWHKMASVARFRRRFDEAKRQLNFAIDIQSDLVKATPDHFVHRCWRALLYRSLAECEQDLKNNSRAKTALASAMRDLDAIDPDSNQQPFVVRTRETVSSMKLLNQ